MGEASPLLDPHVRFDGALGDAQEERVVGFAQRTIGAVFAPRQPGPEVRGQADRSAATLDADDASAGRVDPGGFAFGALL